MPVERKIQLWGFIAPGTKIINFFVVISEFVK